MLSFAFLHPRYCPKIIGHIPKNKKKVKVCLHLWGYMINHSENDDENEK